MPNRIIKEAIRTSRDINNLTDFQFRVWAYLITYVDDYGRGSADPELLKGLVFPRRKGITERQIADALSVLANSGMISLYEVDGESYFCFPKWEKHQTIRAKKSKFPEPQSPELVQAFASKCKQTQADVPVIQSNPNPNPNPDIVTLTGYLSARTDYNEAVEAYNTLCAPTLPAVKQLSKARQGHLKTGFERLQKAGLTWTDYFTLATQSDFLMGRNGAWHGCGFDWLIKPANMLKVIEGNYNNQTPAETDEAERKRQADLRAWRIELGEVEPDEQ